MNPLCYLKTLQELPSACPVLVPSAPTSNLELQWFLGQTDRPGTMELLSQRNN